LSRKLKAERPKLLFEQKAERRKTEAFKAGLCSATGFKLFAFGFNLKIRTLAPV